MTEGANLTPSAQEKMRERESNIELGCGIFMRDFKIQDISVTPTFLSLKTTMA
jgi:hypothetical protein